RVVDLFVSGVRSPARKAPPRIIAEYPYEDLNGRLLAQKVRTDPKSFFWRVPDVRQPDGWRLGRQGVDVGLYRLPKLAGHPQIVVAEGEKAADRLCAVGVNATCPPAGASCWWPAWSEALVALDCRVLVILPDHDTAGVTHAGRVAEIS